MASRTFSEAEKRLLLQTNSAGAFDAMLADLRRALPGTDDQAPYLAFDQKYYLADDILVKSDRMSMAHAVEVRPPYLDHRIVEFAATLPASLKIRGRRQKFLLKDLMKDKLPAAILQRKKMGFDIPAHEWLRGPLRSLLTETLNAGLNDYQELFHTEVIQSFLRSHLERRVNIGYHLWGLMILFLWMKKWRIQAPSSATPKRQSQPEGVGIST